MFAQIVEFLVDTAAAFLVFLLLARFHFQWLRVPFRNPIGEFVVACTNWIVYPTRRVVPSLAGLDLATWLAAWIASRRPGSGWWGHEQRPEPLRRENHPEQQRPRLEQFTRKHRRHRFERESGHVRDPDCQ